MENGEKIVVFQYFDSAIDANIIKTKLDAYGIPCFLTEENMANLYPGVGYHLMSFRVRLHLLSNDVAEATKILNEESNLNLDADSITACPRCHSHKVERDFPRQTTKRFLPALAAAFLGIFLPFAKVYRCLDCEQEFN